MRKEEVFVQKITAILVEQKIISEHEAKTLRNLFARSDHDYFDTFLIEEGLVGDTDLLKALSLYYQVPSFDVGSNFFDRHELIKFPKDVLLRNVMIPFEDDESTLVFVVADPLDSNLLIEIGNFVSYDVQFRVGLRRDICDAIEEFYDLSVTEDDVQTLYDTPDQTHTLIEQEFEEARQRDEQFVHEQEDEDSQ